MLLYIHLDKLPQKYLIVSNILMTGYILQLPKLLSIDKKLKRTNITMKEDWPSW